VPGFCAIRKEVAETSIRVHGDHIAELGLKGRAEVGAASDGNGAPGAYELGEDANVVAVFELDA